MITFKWIEDLARSFPGADVSTSYGTPAIKVGKKLVLRMHQKEDAIVLLLNTVDEQQELIQHDPMAFYITDHYVGYPAVLVRSTVDKSVFRAQMERSWRRVARKSDLVAFEGGGERDDT